MAIDQQSLGAARRPLLLTSNGHIRVRGCFRPHAFRRSLAALCALLLTASAVLWLSTARPRSAEASRESCVLNSERAPLDSTRGLERTPSDPPGTDGARHFRLPRLVHFTARSEILRAEYRPLMERWLAANPGVRFHLWRDEDTACLARRRYPRWLPEFNKGTGRWLKTPLERSDLARVLVLHSLGGLYLDLDTEPVASLDHLFDRPLAGAMFATEPPEHAALLYGLDYLVSNAVMFSVPGHPFLDAYLDAIEAIARRDRRKRSNYDAPFVTGPLVMQRVYEKYKAQGKVACSSPECRVHLFQPEVFSPVHDVSQTTWLKKICTATKLHALEKRKRTVCVDLWARNFSVAEATSRTLAVHQFSHVSTLASKRPPAYFNSSAVFPQLRFFANSVYGNC